MKIVWFDHLAINADGTHLSEQPVLEGFAKIVSLSDAKRITRKEDIPQDAVAFIHSGGSMSDKYWIGTTHRPKAMIFLSSVPYGVQDDLVGVHFARRGCSALAQGLTQSMMDSFLSSCERVIGEYKKLFDELYPKFSTEPLKMMFCLLLERANDLKPDETHYETSKLAAQNEIRKIFAIYPNLKKVFRNAVIENDADEIRKLLACLSSPADCDEEIQLRRLKHSWLENQILNKTPDVVMSLTEWPNIEDNLTQGHDLSELVEQILKRASFDRDFEILEGGNDELSHSKLYEVHVPGKESGNFDSFKTRLSTTLQSFLEALRLFVELWKNGNSENADQVGKHWQNVLNRGTALKESLDIVSKLNLYD